MRCSPLFAAAALAGVTSASTNATVVIDNPTGVTYAATLSGDGVDGSVSAVAHAGGTGVVFTVQFAQLPATGGPFPYHVHVQAVPANGNCTATGGHLDPFAAGDKVACDAAQPQTCQVGDLSGKHGALASSSAGNGSVFSASYVDLYASTNPADAGFFGNRSIVVHAANLTRLACGSFAQVAGAGNATSSAAPSPTSSSSSSTSSGGPVGGAAAVGGGAGRVAGLVVALVVVAVAVL